MGGRLMQNRFIRFGVPFLTLVVGGSFGLQEFAQIRYDFRNRKTITKEEAKELGIEMKDQSEVTLETEFEKIQKIDTSNWENVRGPRPWEEVSELAAVTSMKGWVNNKVRVVGRLRDFNPTKDVAVLESVAEPEGVFYISVNVEAVDQYCVQNNSQVVIFGELEVLKGSPLLTAKIIRECNNLNLQQNSCAIEIVRRSFPHILK